VAVILEPQKEQQSPDAQHSQQLKMPPRASVPPDAISAARAHAGALRELATLFPADHAELFRRCADDIESMAQLAELDAETRDAIDAYELNYGVVL
jgi:hypothetical protein